jgi:hypothetical protein
MNEEELEALAQKAAGLSTDEIEAIAKGIAEGVQEPSPMDDFGRQLGLTGRSVAQGAGSLVGLAYDPIAAVQNKLIGPEGVFPLMAEEVGPLRETIKQTLTSAGVPEPEGATERVVGAIGEAMTAGGLQAKLASALKPFLTGTSQQVTTQLAAQPGQQVAGAAGSGGAAQATAELGGGIAAQLGAGLLGGIVGARGAGTTFEPTPAAVPGAVREAEQAGVRVMTTDVRGPETFAGRWLQRTGEMVPVAGTGGPRAAQQEERIQAVRNVLRDFGAEDAAGASDDVMASLLRKRGQDLNKYTGMKETVIEDLRDAGPVDVSRTVAAIDSEISRLNNLRSDKVRPVIDVLEDWKNSIRGAREVTLPDGTTEMQFSGQGIRNIEELRKIIGNAFASGDLASVRNTGEKSLSRIYAPLREDLEAFVQANGNRGDLNKFKIANRRLSELAGELQNTTLRNALKKGDMTPETIRNMLFSQKPSDVKTLYRNLDAKGKRNARTAVLHEALKKAGGDIEDVSPDRFKQALKKLGTQVGVLFSGDDLRAVEGLARTLKMTERAGQAAVAPPTGVQAAPAIGAAFLTDIFGGFGSGLVAGASVGGLARLYESAPVRNILLKIPQTRVGSPEEAQLIKRLADAVRAQKGTEEGQQ